MWYLHVHELRPGQTQLSKGLDNRPGCPLCACISYLQYRIWQVLDLSCCRGVGDAGIATVAAAGARLHTLSLSSCHQLTDAAFAALGARCGALAHLNACGCELLGDAGLAALAAGARCWP